jgi:acetyltransferase-like isoleucine patch superfamily enzyme
MTEKEKMLLGKMLYRSDSPELMEDREKTKKVMFRYNHILYDMPEDRNAILRSILSRMGECIWIEPPAYIDYGYNIELGDNFYANYSCTFIDSGKIIIGSNVKFGPNVGVYTAEHPIDPVLRAQGYETTRDVIIGDNVWIGGGTVILPGVKIGNNVVVGGGSVVKKDLPDNVVAVGNPCRVIRRVDMIP